MSIDTWREMPQSLEYGAQDDELAALRTRLRDTAAVLNDILLSVDYCTAQPPEHFDPSTACAILKRLKEEGLM